MEFIIWGNCSSSSKNRRELQRREGEPLTGSPNLLNHLITFWEILWFLQRNSPNALIRECTLSYALDERTDLLYWWRFSLTDLTAARVGDACECGERKGTLCNQPNQLNQWGDWCHSWMAPTSQPIISWTFTITQAKPPPFQSQSSSEGALVPGPRSSFLIRALSRD